MTTASMSPARRQRAHDRRAATAVLGMLPAVVPDLLVVVAGDGTLVEVSAASEEVVGFAATDLVGRRACDLLHPDEQPLLLRRIAESHHDDGRGVQAHRVRRSDGGWTWVETSWRAIPPAPDAPGRRLVLSVRDARARLTVEQQLLTWSGGWTAVVEAMREGVVVIDAAGTVVTANAAAGRFLGVAPDALPGSVWPAGVVVLDENGHPLPVDRLPGTRALRTGRLHEESLAYRRRDGSLVWLNARAVPLRAPGDSRVGRVAVLLEDAIGPDVATPARRADGGVVADAARAALTPRERDVLRLLADGSDVRAAARTLDISVHTVRGHVKSLMHKLEARTQLQAVVIALRSGLLDLPVHHPE